MEMNATGGSRRDVHAGSWYSRDNKKLNAQLSEWLSRASTDRRHSRAIISPHAGYDYSGPTAAFAYNQICPDNVKRFFILGPSHYLGMSGKCALSSVDVFETPLYALQVDKDVYQELGRSGEFLRLSVASDEEEHSVEMQLPYVAKVMERRRGAFTIVPIVVGSLSSAREAVYGRILAPYLLNPENLFVISSDFCHWGRRFQYTHYDQQKGAIWQSIQALDEEGMHAIERLSPTDFTAYLDQYGNTICGRHPIGILLQMIESLRKGSSPSIQFDFKFIKYTQSEHCQSMNDSSVSYAAGSLLMR
ncbi:hypothetical protein CRM22_000854 [Opisthorchis felineus]|uniref:MEMO1 family protein n=1 Tax=Opisthorchis felineus TaxID=147828 RepID=A0A4S2MHK4_OPIFE|nr:hypothetical protein CRM22_000854 [Opisthorchis felineus]